MSWQIGSGRFKDGSKGLVGVSSEDMLNIPRGLPYVPKSLNWVRVVQRFPVRISLEKPPEDLMRIGATAVVIVRNDDGC